MHNNQCVVLFSGGMDSTVVLHHAAENFDTVHAISIDYNQRHRRELRLAQDYIHTFNKNKGSAVITHKFIDLQHFGASLTTCALTNLDIDVPKMKDVIGDPQTVAYVPNRNMLFLSAAASVAEVLGATVIFYGAAKADDTSGYWDCTAEFRSLMNQILSLNRRNLIQIEAPLINMTKKEIIEYGVTLGVRFTDTHTCYNSYGTEEACGECPACSARLAGWIQSGYIDPIKYSRTIDWQRYNCKNLI